MCVFSQIFFKMTELSPECHRKVIQTSYNEAVKQKRKGCLKMKKTSVFAVVLFVLAGLLLAFFVIRDRQITVAEAIVCFAYLAAARVIGMLVSRKNSKEAEANEPTRPAAGGGVITTLPTAPDHKRAA